MMNRSKATKYVVAYEIFSVDMGKKSSTYSFVKNIVDPETVVPLHPGLAWASQLAKSIQITLIENLVLPLVTQLEALLGLHALQANLDI